MSKTIKRNVLIVLFAVIATFSVAFSFVFKSASAAETDTRWTTTKYITMEEGMSVSLNAQQPGIRARVQITNDGYEALNNNDATLEVWFVSKTQYDMFKSDTSKTVTQLKNNAAAVVEVPAGKIYQENGSYFANAVVGGSAIHDLKDVDFVSIGAWKSDNTYIFAAFAENDVAHNTRTLEWLVNETMFETTDEGALKTNQIRDLLSAYEWYGTEESPIKANTERLTALVAINDSLTDRYVANMDKASVPGGLTSATMLTPYTVTVKVGEQTVDTYTGYTGGSVTSLDLTDELSAIKAEDNAKTDADDSTQYLDAWTITEGEGSIDNITGSCTITATMGTYNYVTFVDTYNAEEANKEAATFKVKDGGSFSEDQIAEVFDLILTLSEPADDADAGDYLGYNVTMNGETTPYTDVEFNSNLESIAFTHNATVSLRYEKPVYVSLNVYTEAYALDGSAPAGTVHKASMRYGAGTKKYLDKTSEFTDLTKTNDGKSVIKSYKGDKIDLTAFLKNLPEAYKLNTTVDGCTYTVTTSETASGTTYMTSQAVVDGENTINVYLDANEEELGFSMKDIYYTRNSGFASDGLDKLGDVELKRLPTGDVGAYLSVNASKTNWHSISLHVTQDDVTKESYKSVYVTTQINIAEDAFKTIYLSSVSDTMWSNGGSVYGVGATALSYKTINSSADDQNAILATNTWGYLNGNALAPLAETDTLEDIIISASGNGSPWDDAGRFHVSVLIQSVQYNVNPITVNPSTESNTTLNPTDMRKSAYATSNSGRFTITKDDAGVDVLRYKATTANGTDAYGRWGVAFNFSNIDISKFDAINVKFKLINQSGNLKININVNSVERAGWNDLNFDPTEAKNGVVTWNLLNLPPYDATKIRDEVWYVSMITDRKPLMSDFKISSQSTSGFSIDIYSIEFVVKTAAETPEA